MPSLHTLHPFLRAARILVHPRPVARTNTGMGAVRSIICIMAMLLSPIIRPQEGDAALSLVGQGQFSSVAEHIVEELLQPRVRRVGEEFVGRGRRDDAAPVHEDDAV